MDTRYLQTFREVAKWQSFTRAAEVLGYAQSSVTTQIQIVESEFGVSLFERWGRKIRLTREGEILLGYSEQMLSLLEEAHDRLHQEEQLTGTLTIGTVESLAAFFLPPYLQLLRQEHPQVKLLVVPGICSDLRVGVREGAYDFALILDRIVVEQDLHCINLGEVELVVVAARTHPLSAEKHVDASQFASHNWIFTEMGCSYRAMMESVLRDAGIRVDTPLEFGSLEAIKQCVAYGLGLAILPRIAVEDELEKGKLAVLPFSHPDIRVYRQLVYHRKKKLSAGIRRFFEQLANSSVDKDGEQDETV
ncbi:LysR family transcriptional regulator [Brevibacillus fluminis]|uniref:LysR family transcriptional regulator n=1 Tax=Brevibacillus fluminis TaxID=511487 RepID=A0A3M8DUF1_9BACL|nr:LysR family transcriptional regulator [Brevibacillus fluminis]RNB91129.1 LysR family transcriptional regulator [Brevibacillus fluminis]